MQIDYPFHNVRHAPRHLDEGELSSLGLSIRDRLVLSALTAAGTASIILSQDIRAFLSMLLEVAWLYMVAGARG
jgi:hypothetical protein